VTLKLQHHSYKILFIILRFSIVLLVYIIINSDLNAFLVIRFLGFLEILIILLYGKLVFQFPKIERLLVKGTLRLILLQRNLEIFGLVLQILRICLHHSEINKNSFGLTYFCSLFVTDIPLILILEF